ncbi:MAG: aromatic amino acid transaminase, partial [Planctomycetota bacterium]
GRSGVYRNADGECAVFPCVREAAARVVAEETTKDYLDLAGLPAFCDAVTALLLGDGVRGKAATTLQTPGGTAALRVFGELARARDPDAAIWLSDPTWGNHRSVFAAAGLDVNTYPWPVTEETRLDFPALLTAIAEIPAGGLVLLHGCCHNPTGVDPTLGEWRELGALFRKHGLIPVVDTAFLGYAEGVEEDLAGVRALFREVPEAALATSWSKPFCLYNERVGSLTLVGEDPDSVERARRHAKLVVRASYSNPPHHGAAIVARILGDPDLRREWHGELESIRRRLRGMRERLAARLTELGVPGDHRHVLAERSVFTRLSLTDEQVAALRREHAVYLGRGGGMNVVAMTEEQLDHVCRALAEITRG